MSAIPTMMIVDDSRVSRMMIKAIVKDKKPDWDIVEADCGEQALELCNGQDINYFSLDLNMPGMDGLELLEKLKPNNPKARFVLLTANIQKATHERAKKLDTACVNKPINDACISKILEYFNE